MPQPPRLLLPGIPLQKTNVIHSIPYSYLFKRAPLLKAAVQLCTATTSTALEIPMWSMMLTVVIALDLETPPFHHSVSSLAVHNIWIAAWLGAQNMLIAV